MSAKLANVRATIARHWDGAKLPRLHRGWDKRWHLFPRKNPRYADCHQYHRRALRWAVRHPILAWRLWST